MIRYFCFVVVLFCTVSPPALATFPVGPLDCSIFATDDPNFLGHNFGFGSEITYSNASMPTVTTGFEGFIAPPEQVAPIPDFLAGVDLPVGEQSLSDLFEEPSVLPENLDDGWISQAIRGEGDFGGGFTSVTLTQRKLLGGEQAGGDFAFLAAQGKGYAPFEVTGSGGAPVDVRFTIDLFSTFHFTGEGALSEGVGSALLNVTDPDNATLMDGVTGFYFASDAGTDASFTRHIGEQKQDITDTFATGPLTDAPDSPHFSSFAYTIETQLNEGQTYALGLLGDGAIDLNNLSSAMLDSSGTLLVSIDVVTPGARLVLPGFAIPEPVALGLAVLAVGMLLCRRGRAVA